MPEKIKRKKAVALAYNENDIAPRVLAKGKGLIAQNIIDKANENDVKIYEDKALVDELTKIDIGDSIPPELYEVIAQILVFIDDMDKLASARNEGS